MMTTVVTMMTMMTTEVHQGLQVFPTTSNISLPTTPQQLLLTDTGATLKYP
jgi:hypothetical protein